MTAYLVLESGDVFTGTWIGKRQSVQGDLVFNTVMGGMADVLADPSSGGHIVTFTYPLIGQDLSKAHADDSRFHAAGAVIGEWTAAAAKKLAGCGIAGIAGVDTRAVMRRIRQLGSVRAAIKSDPRALSAGPAPGRDSLRRVARASVSQPVTYAGASGEPHLVMIDYGHHPSLIRALKLLGCTVTVVPFNWPNARIAALKPDGLILSSGPGNPAALQTEAESRRPLFQEVPTMGIGLGCQVVARAFGAATERAKRGHHGRNYPVLNLDDGTVAITEQNHSYVIARASLDEAEWRVTHVNVNDGSVEGVCHTRHPVRGVQFRPGPYADESEARAFFRSFLTDVIDVRKETAYVQTRIHQ